MNLAITFEVCGEFLMVKEADYDFVDDILKQRFKFIHLDFDLTSEYERIKVKLTYLHAGELRSILSCRKGGWILQPTTKRRRCIAKMLVLDGWIFSIY